MIEHIIQWKAIENNMAQVTFITRSTAWAMDNVMIFTEDQIRNGEVWKAARYFFERHIIQVQQLGKKNKQAT